MTAPETDPRTLEIDPLDATRMSIGEHLEELRRHVLRALLYLFLATLAALSFQDQILEVMTWPHRSTMAAIRNETTWKEADRHLSRTERGLLEGIVERRGELDSAFERLERKSALLTRRSRPGDQKDLTDLQAAWRGLLKRAAELEARQDRLLEQDRPDPGALAVLKGEFAKLQKDQTLLRERSLDAERIANDRAARAGAKLRLQQLRYQEAFMSYLKAAFVVALFVAAPFIGRELWAFIAAGLYDHEKRWVNIVAPLSYVIFLVGVLFGYFVLIPFGLRYLATYAGPELVESSITLSDYLSLFITLTLVVGVFFQLPLLMSFACLIRVVTWQFFAEKRRYFLLVAVIVGAMFTPPDPVTQMLLAGPLVLLYEVGIWLCRFISLRREDPPEPPAAPPATPPEPPGDSGGQAPSALPGPDPDAADEPAAAEDEDADADAADDADDRADRAQDDDETVRASDDAELDPGAAPWRDPEEEPWQDQAMDPDDEDDSWRRRDDWEPSPDEDPENGLEPVSAVEDSDPGPDPEEEPAAGDEPESAEKPGSDAPPSKSGEAPADGDEPGSPAPRD